MDQVRIGDVGTRFTATITEDGTAVDISTASIKEIHFKKPSEEVLTKTATFVTDGSDGKIYYDSVAGDFDELGVWQWQAYIETPGGKWSTEIRKFECFDKLKRTT